MCCHNRPLHLQFVRGNGPTETFRPATSLPPAISMTEVRSVASLSVSCTSTSYPSAHNPSCPLRSKPAVYGSRGLNSRQRLRCAAVLGLFRWPAWPSFLCLVWLACSTLSSILYACLRQLRERERMWFRLGLADQFLCVESFLICVAGRKLRRQHFSQSRTRRYLSGCKIEACPIRR